MLATEIGAVNAAAARFHFEIPEALKVVSVSVSHLIGRRIIRVQSGDIMEKMNIGIMEFRKYEACYKQGFVNLDWQEIDDEVDGGHFHAVWVVGQKIVLHVSIEHKSFNPKVQRKIYEIRLGFHRKSESGDIFYLNQPHTEYSLESAMMYARWQATLILKLIEGDFAA